MDVYHLALFLHLLSLFAASAASAVTHLAEARVRRAATVREARQWHAVAGSAARTFPIVIVTLLVTGGIMVWRGGGVFGWSTGWIVAGVAGVALLFLNGGVLGRHGGMAARDLARQESERGPDAAPAITPDALAARLGWANTGVAIAVTFVMVTKPALPVSLGLLVAGAVLGAAMARTPQVDATREGEEALAA